MSGDAVDRGGVQVPAVHDVQVDQGHPQPHVGGGRLAAQHVFLGGQPPLQGVQRAQQGAEGGLALRGGGVGPPGALGRVVDAVPAQARHGLDLAFRAPRVQHGPSRAAVAEAPGQVGQDVRGVVADDPARPGVAQHGGRGRTGIPVAAGPVQRAQRRVPAVGLVGHGRQQGHREDLVETEEAVGDGDGQTVRAGRRQVQAVAAGHGVVAAAGVGADPAAEGGQRRAGRHGGRWRGGHVSPRVRSGSRTVRWAKAGRRGRVRRAAGAVGGWSRSGTVAGVSAEGSRRCRHAAGRCGGGRSEGGTGDACAPHARRPAPGVPYFPPIR
ncbi:Hypothetical Protein sle_06310 [Streptomyces leeuwenhoekii]|uniref:Uncharacterized protein n=1 Tax=Streptomyces leeuwenhoekii TaxID=1437453 RepID=A0A0F7VL60_STRLW|nr:Hypothetical Protein sle_06310 [Streptomyces leeuwenhoekii]